MSMATFGMGGFAAEGGSASELIPQKVDIREEFITLSTNVESTVISEQLIEIVIDSEYTKSIRDTTEKSCLIP